MALKLHDDLAEIIKDTSPDDRITNLLWAILKYNYRINIAAHLRHDAMRREMASALHQNPQIAHAVTEAIRRRADPARLKWIEDCRIQRTWIEQKLSGNPIVTSELARHLSNKEVSSLIIDFHDAQQISIRTIAQTLHSEWEQQEKEDRKFDWFKQDEEETKCEFAWDFLRKKNYSLGLLTEKFSNIEDLLVYVYTNKPSEDTIELLLKNAKSRWSQKEYRRKNAEKKQCNLILSKNAINRLKNLADKYDVSQAKIIEILLKMEDEEGAYIPKRIKALMDDQP